MPSNGRAKLYDFRLFHRSDPSAHFWTLGGVRVPASEISLVPINDLEGASEEPIAGSEVLKRRLLGVMAPMPPFGRSAKRWYPVPFMVRGTMHSPEALGVTASLLVIVD